MKLLNLKDKNREISSNQTDKTNHLQGGEKNQSWPQTSPQQHSMTEVNWTTSTKF